jgi:hypothetical protein
MPRTKSRERILPMLGVGAKEIDRELKTFSRAARVLSSNRPRLIHKHPKQWIGVHDGRVEVTASSLKALLARLKTKGLSPNSTIIRYIDTKPRKLIL